MWTWLAEILMLFFKGATYGYIPVENLLLIEFPSANLHLDFEIDPSDRNGYIIDTYQSWKRSRRAEGVECCVVCGLNILKRGIRFFT